MSPNQKKALLGVAIAICLAVAGDRIYKFWESRQPLAQPGECLEIEDPRYGSLKLHVIENDNEKQTTDAVIDVEVIPGLKLQVPIRAPYQELRNAGAKKVSCE